MKFLSSAAVVLCYVLPSTQAFVPKSKSSLLLNRQTKSSKHAMHMSNNQNLVIISPPGGVGEVAAVKAAEMGSTVKWFVISAPDQTSSALTISSETLESIEGKGKLEFAGAPADTLLLPLDDQSSALSAISTWCAGASSIICAVDGVEEAVIKAARAPGVSATQMDPSELARSNKIMMDAVKVAAKEACSKPGTMKVAIMPAISMEESKNKKTEEKKDDEGKKFLSSLFNGNKVEVPSTLTNAMTSDSSSANFATLRYGELFGIPESSPDASPLIGGLRRYPVLRDEYTMKSIRIDPTLSVAGNVMTNAIRSSRLSVGEAAVRMAMGTLDLDDGIDVCLTSQRGIDEPDEEDWIEEFSRVQEMLSSGKGAQLFSATFGSVPSIDRLSEWVATKWAPAVMKGYDIAGIRVGARPVIASVVGEGKVEIVWQNIVDFSSVLTGKMIIEITDTGISAIRGGGDASKGYGGVSSSPLPGEDILVRRLSDAATQAMEKGLATKPAPKQRKKKEVQQAAVVTTFVPAVAADIVPEPVATPSPTSSETGPRSSGARRSSERARGRRRKTELPTKEDNKSGSWE